MGSECEKELLKQEIQKLKEQQYEMRERIKDIDRLERLKEKERVDIASRLKNKEMLDYVFPYYNQVCTDYMKMSGKVTLRRRKNMPHDFTTIRNLAKTIANYTIFSKRKDGYVEQSIQRRNLNQMDDTEINLISQCTDEIIAVLYKYKMLCSKHQNIDNSEFVIERGVVDET